MLMRTAAVVVGMAVGASAQAHPGHPAVSVEHSHAFFGIDPIYAGLFLGLGLALAVAWRVARRRLACRARR